MKKLSVFLIMLMAAALLVLPAFAAQTATFSVSASNTAVLPGDTFTVTVSTSKVDNCTTGGFMFSYDKNAFEYVSGVSLSGLTGFNAGVSTQAGNVAGYFMNGTGTVQGDIFQITLKVKDSASGAYTISGTPNMSAGGESVSCSANSVTVTVGCVHSYADWTKVDDGKHLGTCTKCKATTEEDHDWNDGVGKPAPSCEQGGTFEYTCSYCRATKTEDADAIGHKYDNNCDATCNNCGTDRVPPHNYSTTYSSNADGHWYACSCGAQKDFAAHIPGPAATEKAAQTCTVCNYEIAPILPHEHSIGKDWVSDSVYHWHRCTKYGCNYVQDKVRHKYDDNCDVSCNVCNHIRDDAPHNFRPELQANAQGHWQVCASCNVKSEVFPHVPGPEATETDPQVCTECNFRIKMPLGHTHNYGDAWYSDDDSHWQSCADCAETTPVEPHEWDEGEELEDGSIRYTCTVCAKEVTLSDPVASEPETTPPTQTATPTAPKPTEPKDSERFPWQWAGIAAIVLMIVGIALLVIEVIRSRKSNMHGRFSK